MINEGIDEKKNKNKFESPTFQMLPNASPTFLASFSILSPQISPLKFKILGKITFPRVRETFVIYT